MQINGRIQFINPPEGNRPGNIKVDGRYISVPTQMLNQFQRGSQVSLEIREKEVNGRTYFNLVNVIANGDVPVPPKTNGGSPNFVGSVALPQAPANTNTQARDIFVTSWVKESTRIGKCVLPTLEEYVVAAKTVWEKVIDGKIPHPTAQPRYESRYQPPAASQQPRSQPQTFPDDLNDDIRDIGDTF